MNRWIIVTTAVTVNKHTARYAADGRCAHRVGTRIRASQLDRTFGNDRGTMCLRWVRASTSIPHARVVALSDLERELR